MKNIGIVLLSLLLLSACKATVPAHPKAASSAPTYPKEAARNGVEGYVKMLFDITKDGKPYNIRVVESVPEGVFDEVAQYAVSTWAFPPKIVDGKAVVQTDMNVQLDYKLDKDA